MQSIWKGPIGPMCSRNDADRTPDSYQTLASAGEAEMSVQRSRFLAMACPAGDDGEARELALAHLGVTPAPLSTLPRVRGG